MMIGDSGVFSFPSEATPSSFLPNVLKAPISCSFLVFLVLRKVLDAAGPVAYSSFRVG